MWPFGKRRALEFSAAEAMAFLRRRDLSPEMVASILARDTTAEHHATVESHVNELWVELQEEMERWPEVTDNERLANALSALTASGVFSLENCGLNPRDGGFVLCEEYETRYDKDVPDDLAYVFYCQADVDAAIRGEGLLLSFDRPSTAERLIEELRASGLQPRWDGDVKSRVRVPFVWQRRDKLKAY